MRLAQDIITCQSENDHMRMHRNGRNKEEAFHTLMRFESSTAFRMTGPTPDPVTPVNQVTRNDDNPNNSPSLQDQILDHIGDKEKAINKGAKEEEDEDLQNPYKEVLKSPFTRRIIEFSAQKHRMPTNLKIYDGSTNPDDHITGWTSEKIERFALRRKCFKDPTEVSKIIQRANETLMRSLGWHLEEIHVTWIHLEKKRTRLRLYTIYLEELCIQSVETASQASSDAVVIFLVTALRI
ncbi:hypothetical protein Tco_1268841 [Tanacetum coccineum]